MPGSLITLQLMATTDCITLAQAVDIKRQQLHELWQDELPSGGGCGTVLPVTGQDVGCLSYQVLLNLYNNQMHFFVLLSRYKLMLRQLTSGPRGPYVTQRKQENDVELQVWGRKENVLYMKLYPM